VDQTRDRRIRHAIAQELGRQPIAPDWFQQIQGDERREAGAETDGNVIDV
jgi:hypothetical protein